MKQPWQWTVYTWLPVHRSSKGQAKLTKTSLFWHLDAIQLHRHLWRLKESSFVLVALNVTRHLSPHSTILRRSNSIHLVHPGCYWLRALVMISGKVKHVIGFDYIKYTHEDSMCGRARKHMNKLGNITN